jgi:hypothetical protein
VRHGVWLWLCIAMIAAFVAWRIGGEWHA